MMLDLHTHTVLSDGVLTPAELVRRAETKGYGAIVLSDHVDSGTLAHLAPILVKEAEDLTKFSPVRVFAGVEITHCRLEQIPIMVQEARSLGIRVVIVHGETIAEPVIRGTNRAAIEAGADIIAHPGLIGEEDVRLAAERGVRLEISARKGHCLTNGYVASIAKRFGASLVFGSDMHEPSDMLTKEEAEKVLLGAGLSREEGSGVFRNMEELLRLSRSR